MQMYINLFGQRGRAAKEIHADAPGIAFQYLQCHWVKLPVVHSTQEIGIAISVQKSSIDVAGHSPPLVNAVRVDVIDSIILNIEDPVVTRLEEVDFLSMVLFPLQSCFNVCYRKTQPPH